MVNLFQYNTEIRSNDNNRQKGFNFFRKFLYFFEGKRLYLGK